MATTRDVSPYVVGAYLAAQSNVGNSLGYCMLDCVHLRLRWRVRGRVHGLAVSFALRCDQA